MTSARRKPLPPEIVAKIRWQTERILDLEDETGRLQRRLRRVEDENERLRELARTMAERLRDNKRSTERTMSEPPRGYLGKL